MKTKLWTIIAAVLVTVPWGSCTQVLAAPPQRWSNWRQIGEFCLLRPLDLPYNKPESIRQELLDPRLVRLMAASRGLSEKQLADVRLAAEPGSGWVNLYQVGKSTVAFEALGEDLEAYVRARRNGHSQDCLVAALTNRLSVASIRDPDLRILATNQPLFAVSWARKTGSGTSTNKAGEVVSQTTAITTVKGKQVTNVVVEIPKVDAVHRWACFVVVDGEVAWNYFLEFKVDGTLRDIGVSKCDARDVDPKWEPTMAQIAQEAKAELQRRGFPGGLGWCHFFWDVKKAKLRAKGIVWRSPAELNPDTY